MNIEDILSKCDHTLLDRQATEKDIISLLDDAIKYKTASACIPPCFVERAKAYVGDRVKICTVIGFPNGYNTEEVKAFETVLALKQGADEIDTVVNLCDLRDKNYNKILHELKTLKACCGDKVLKVIVETCLLTEEEKIKMCEIVTESGADFIKTSTGFSTGGATFADVELFKKHVGKNVKIKAAGGISSLRDAEHFIEIGADRLGTSRVVKAVKASEK